jgi:hypothetical protein
VGPRGEPGPAGAPGRDGRDGISPGAAAYRLVPVRDPDTNLILYADIVPL